MFLFVYLDVKVRAEENTKKMQLYTSHIPSPLTPNPRLHPLEHCEKMYRKYVAIADEYRVKLRDEKPELWLQFFPLTDKSTLHSIEEGDV